MMKFEKLLRLFRRLFWSKKFGAIGKRLSLGKEVTFDYPHCIFIGDNVRIGNYSYFLPCVEYEGVKYSPKIVVGNGCSIGIRNSFACINQYSVNSNVIV